VKYVVVYEPFEHCASGNARKTMKCGRRWLLISMRDRSGGICRVFHDAKVAMISAND
jgi:hypothetical protein